MESFNKQSSVLLETGAYLAQLERENNLLEKQLEGLIESPFSEEQALKDYDLPANPAPSTSIPSKPKHDKYDSLQQQVTYLEKRLASQESQIKRLEELIFQRNSQITALERQSRRAQSPAREFQIDQPIVHTTLAIISNSNEKKLEKKVEECEKKMIEQRKSMQKLQNLNRNLLEKIKDHSLAEDEYKRVIEKVQVKESKANGLIEVNQALSVQNNELHSHLITMEEELRSRQESYNNLLATSIDFEQRSQELFELNQILNQKVQIALKKSD